MLGMKTRFLVVTGVIFIVFLYFFTRKPPTDRFLGKLAIPDMENLSFNLYQENAWDMATAIDFELVNQNDSLLVKRCFLTGTHNYEKDTRFFHAGSFDSIVYLAYGDSKEVEVLFDLKKNQAPCFCTNAYDPRNYQRADSLLRVLQKANPQLRASWH